MSDYTEKMQVYEKKFCEETNEYINERGNSYTVERHTSAYLLQTELLMYGHQIQIKNYNFRANTCVV